MRPSASLLPDARAHRGGERLSGPSRSGRRRRRPTAPRRRRCAPRRPGAPREAPEHEEFAGLPLESVAAPGREVVLVEVVVRAARARRVVVLVLVGPDLDRHHELGGDLADLRLRLRSLLGGQEVESHRVGPEATLAVGRLAVERELDLLGGDAPVLVLVLLEGHVQHVEGPHGYFTPAANARNASACSKTTSSALSRAFVSSESSSSSPSTSSRISRFDASPSSRSSTTSSASLSPIFFRPMACCSFEIPARAPARVLRLAGGNVLPRAARPRLAGRSVLARPCAVAARLRAVLRVAALGVVGRPAPGADDLVGIDRQPDPYLVHGAHPSRVAPMQQGERPCPRRNFGELGGGSGPRAGGPCGRSSSSSSLEIHGEPLGGVPGLELTGSARPTARAVGENSASRRARVPTGGARAFPPRGGVPPRGGEGESRPGGARARAAVRAAVVVGSSSTTGARLGRPRSGAGSTREPVSPARRPARRRPRYT